MPKITQGAESRVREQERPSDFRAMVWKDGKWTKYPGWGMKKMCSSRKRYFLRWNILFKVVCNW